MNFTFMNDNIKSTEEKKLVMNKTISASTNPSDETIKVDYLDSNNQIEKDVIAERKAERDVTGTLPLPLFRFVEKQKREIINFIDLFIKVAISIKKDDHKYDIISKYLEIPEMKNILHIMDLTINRNKELYKSTPKDFKLELISCYFEKKLRVKYNIPEDALINKSENMEYFNTRTSIYNVFKEYFETVSEACKLKNSGTDKDIELTFEPSEGDENYGAGFSIFLIYKKMIDYSNERRGKEAYNGIFDLLDSEFANSINEQNSIKINRSTEAIADGMGDDSEGSGDETGSNDESADSAGGEEGTNEDDGLSMGEADDEGEGGDSEDYGMDDSGDDGDSEGDDSSGDDYGSDDSSSSDSSDSNTKLKSGINPFADINSKERVATELNELKEQIDKVLKKLEIFQPDIVVKKLIELSSVVKDALKSAYIMPVEDTLIRYSLYVTQFDDLISKLKRSFEKTHKKDTQKNS